MKSAVLSPLLFLAVGLGGARAGGAPAPYTAEFEKSPPEARFFDRERYRRIAGEEQERYRKRVAIPDAVGENIQVAAFARPLGSRTKMTARVPADSRLQVLLLGAACILAGTLTLLPKLFPRIASAISAQFNPWALSPATATGLSAKVRAEEEALSEFVAAFQLGPRVAPGTSVSSGGLPVSRVPKEQASEAAPRLEHDPAAAFLSRTPELVAASRKLIQDIGGASDTAARQKMLGDLCGRIRHLKGEASIPGLLPAWQMACALEGLLKQLTDRVSNATSSTLRTVAMGLDLLEDLCQPGLRADLCTQPPFRLLAVDDDPISRHAVSFALKRGLNEPDLAKNGEGALALAAKQSYDVIFLDVQMPCMDGFELCSRIHDTTPNGTTPVVFVTCQSDFKARAQSTLCGGNDLIGKPFLTFEITVKALTLALRRRLQDRPQAADAAHRSIGSKPLSLLPPEAGAAVGAVAPAKSQPGAPESVAPPTVSALAAPAHLAGLHDLIQAINQTVDEAPRQALLADLLRRIQALAPPPDCAEPGPAGRMSAALENLLNKLLKQPKNTTPSTFQTMAAAVDLLGDLCVPGLRADLASRPPIHLLVVDDDLVSRRALDLALRKAFAEPDLARDGETAVTLVKQRPYDLIFLDLDMPGMDGFELCCRIRQTAPNATTPVVFVTRYSDLGARSKASQSGGQDLIAKPYLVPEIALKALTLVLRSRLENSGAKLGSAEPHTKPARLPKPASSLEVPTVVVPTDHGLPVPERREGEAEGATKPPAAEGLQGVDGLAGRDTAAPLLRAARCSTPGATPDKDPDESDDPARVESRRNEAPNLFHAQAPTRLKQLQNQLLAARQDADSAVRQQLLGELSVAVHSFAVDTQHTALNSTHRLGSALEKLLRKLHQREDFCTPTALEAAGAALDLLEELCQSGLEPDLAAPPMRILVVDDDLIARRAFAGAVQLAFGRPESAASGEAALALAGEMPFDLIFLDMCMPGMDGFTTCSRIHQTAANRHTPILFVTGHSDLKSRSQAAHSGGCGFVPKPVLAAEIMVTALTVALRGRLSQPRSVPVPDAAVLPATKVNNLS